MVGFVIVSHCETLAKGVVELTRMMAASVPIQAAGGLDDGGRIRIGPGQRGIGFI